MNTWDQRAHDVLIGLLMISEGKAGMALDLNQGGESDHIPQDEQAWHDYHRRQIFKSHGKRREEAIETAERALQIARGGLDRQRSSLEWDEFVVRRYAGWSTARVAEAENCHRQQVYRARLKLKVNTADGLPVAA